MKIVLVNQGDKTYNMSPNGYMDTYDPYLKFGVVLAKDTNIQQLYADFTTGDTSSIKFTYDNGEFAWVKNAYNTLTSFKIETNQPLGHNPDTDTDNIGDVAWIELSKDDAGTRLASAETTIANQNKTIEQLQKQIASMSSQLSSLSSTVSTMQTDVTNVKSEIESTKQIMEAISTGDSATPAIATPAIATPVEADNE